MYKEKKKSSINFYVETAPNNLRVLMTLTELFKFSKAFCRRENIPCLSLQSFICHLHLIYVSFCKLRPYPAPCLRGYQMNMWRGRTWACGRWRPSRWCSASCRMTVSHRLHAPAGCISNAAPDPASWWRSDHQIQGQSESCHLLRWWWCMSQEHWDPEAKTENEIL